MIPTATIGPRPLRRCHDVDDVVEKPFAPEDLVACVRRVAAARGHWAASAAGHA